MSVIGIECPDGLTEREVAAFRLGALCVLLAAEHTYLPGATRKQYEHEVHRHEALLSATAEAELELFKGYPDYERWKAGEVEEPAGG